MNHLDIVDAQAHIFLTIGEDKALAAMDALGITGVMIDEVWGLSGDEKSAHGQLVEPFITLPGGRRRPVSPRAQAASLRHPARFSYIQRIEREDPELECVVAAHAAWPGCRQFRVDLRLPRELVAFREGGYDAMISLMRRHGIALSLLGRGHAVDVAPTIARFPDVKFVLDHCGSPRTPEEWEQVLALAPLPNLWMKWSAPGKAFADTYPFAKAAAQLERALDAFGVSRLMWASDFTQNPGSWADLLNYLRWSPVLSEGDRQRFFAGTAREVFDWPAGNGAVKT